MDRDGNNVGNWEGHAMYRLLVYLFLLLLQGMVEGVFSSRRPAMSLLLSTSELAFRSPCRAAAKPKGSP